MGGPAGRRRGERRVPVVQRPAHPRARGGKVVDLAIDGVQDPLRGGAHVAARRAAGVAHAEERRELVEREAEPLRAADHVEALDDRWRVDAIAGRRALRFRQEPDPLVVADRVDADAARRREPADREHAVHAAG